MSRINMFYDARPIVESIKSKTSSRSGIYWAAYNMLRQFEQSPLFNITLGVPPRLFFIKQRMPELFISSPSFVAIYDKKIFQYNIEIEKDKIKKTKNIFFIGFRLLKIINNLITLLLCELYLSERMIKQLNNIGVVFSPLYSMPDIIKNIPSIKSFQVLHDCIPVLDNVSSKKIDPNHWFTKLTQGLDKETYYFLNSECTKNDFVKYFPNQLDAGKLLVIPHATSQNFYPNYDKAALHTTLKKYGITANSDDLYIFSLCNIDPRKNLIFTIKCLIKFIEKNNIENLHFYLGGGYFKGYIEQFKQEISNFNEYNNKIILLGYVDDEDVNIFLSNSLFFTFLSQYEGFGVPPLEAMQAGTPVICSNNSSLPEVVGDAAITVDYNSEEQCIKAFEDLYFNEARRKHYIEKGLARAKLFSWEKTVNRMTEVITKVLDGQ